MLASEFHQTRFFLLQHCRRRKTGGQADAAATARMRPFDRNYCSGLAEISYARTTERRGAESPFRYANSASFRGSSVRVTSQADPTNARQTRSTHFGHLRKRSSILHEKRETSRCPAFWFFFFSLHVSSFTFFSFFFLLVLSLFLELAAYTAGVSGRFLLVFCVRTSPDSLLLYSLYVVCTLLRVK